MNFRKIATLATAGTVAAGMCVLGFGMTPAFAVNGVEPITFEVGASGSLVLAQIGSTGTALVQATAVDMPVTSVTDSRNGTTRSWTVSASASNLTGPSTILASAITVAQAGTFTTGSGTVGALGLVSASADTIGSVYTYTPTALLAAQGNIAAGAYSGTVTQTVV